MFPKAPPGPTLIRPKEMMTAGRGPPNFTPRSVASSPKMRWAEVEGPSKEIDPRRVHQNVVVQDLLYRTEYLASLVSKTSALKKPLDVDVENELAGSSLPHAIGATSARIMEHNARELELSTMGQSLRYIRAGARGGEGGVNPFEGESLLAAQWDLDKQMRHTMQVGSMMENVRYMDRSVVGSSSAAVDYDCYGYHAKLPANTARDVANHPRAVAPARVFTSASSGEDTAAAVLDCGPNSASGEQATAESSRSAIFSATCKPPEDALSGLINETTLRPGGELTVRNTEDCCMINLTDIGYKSGNATPGDLAFAQARYAEFFAKHRGIPCRFWSRFRRVDGDDDRNSARKFTLSESGTVLVRQESHPFASSRCTNTLRALVTADRPIRCFPEGHYFEVRIKTIFLSAIVGRERFEPVPCLVRPGEFVSRVRTEGLVLGMTATPPSQIRTSARSAGEVPRSWSVSTSGSLFVNNANEASVPPPRPTPTGTLTAPPSWQRTRHQAQHEQTRRLWPSPDADAARLVLDWCSPLSEESTVGMLVTPSGGISITLNGEVRLSLPDAGVQVDSELWPLVEVCNRVRSVQALPAAKPPGSA